MEYSLEEYEFKIEHQDFVVMNIATGEHHTYDLLTGTYLLKITNEVLILQISEKLPPAFQHDFDVNTSTFSVDKTGMKFAIVGAIDVDNGSGEIINKEVEFLFDLDGKEVEISFSTFDQNVLSVRTSDASLRVCFHEGNSEH